MTLKLSTYIPITLNSVVQEIFTDDILFFLSINICRKNTTHSTFIIVNSFIAVWIYWANISVYLVLITISVFCQVNFRYCRKFVVFR